MEAKHSNGSTLTIAGRYDLRTAQLLRDCGYTHVKRTGWDWTPIDTEIVAMLPRSAWYLPAGMPV